jgi:tetratricopeptide (TPR) repeat protein
MALAAKGLFCLMMSKREMVAVAQEAYTAALKAEAQGGATQRERLWVKALGAWLAGSPSSAIQIMEQALLLNPADTISMKLSHGIRFIIGDNHGMRRSVERVIGAHSSDHALRGYALGCLAFAQEETGSYGAAETTGLQALALAPDDAWGMHAVAHVYDMTHNPAEGIALIEGHTSAWDHCNNFRFHVWWHKALLHMDQGDHAEALLLYDTKIRDEKTDDYRDVSNASSLLMRLELEGISVGHRWNELANLAEKRSNDGCLVFADLHYMLALAGDNRSDAAARLVARVSQSATKTDETAGIMRSPGLAAAEGLAAFGEAEYDTAYKHLSNAQPSFQNMGGSHAQRDIFERLTIDAAVRSGALEDAERLVMHRTSIRDGAADSFATARLNTIRDLQHAVAQQTAAQ